MTTDRLRLTRRSFLKAGGAIGAGAYLALKQPQNVLLQTIPGIDNPLAFYPERDWEKVYRDQYRYDRTFTFICAPNDTHICRLRAFVRNEVVVRAEQAYEADQVTDLYGNRIAASWNPRGCLKGYTLIHRTYGPYRVQHPVVRKGWKTWADKGFPVDEDGRPAKDLFRRGEDDWVRVSWDEAATYVANGLLHVMEKYGGEAGAETVAQAGGQRVDAAALGVERAQGGLDRGLRTVAVHIGWLELGHAAVVGSG